MVQVAKNPMGTKGPRLTSYITLPGRHIVYMPTICQISVSRRIEDEDEKERLKSLITEVGREGEGYIVRTAGEGRTKEDFMFLRFRTIPMKMKSQHTLRSVCRLHRMMETQQQLMTM